MSGHYQSTAMDLSYVQHTTILIRPFMMEWNAITEDEISMEERRGKSSDIEECKLLKISTK